MSVCGYHPLMGEGIRTFTKGLQLALETKASRKSRPIHQHLYTEADEIAILKAFVERKRRESGEAPDATLGFLGIIYLCHSLMGDLVKLAGEKGDLQQALSIHAEELISFLQTFEDHFEACPHDSAVAKTQLSWAATQESLSKEPAVKPLRKASLKPVG